MMSDDAVITRRHWHPFAFHRHPDWHGHCVHLGELWDETHWLHRCRRWHFHLSFSHRHTETPR